MADIIAGEGQSTMAQRVNKVLLSTGVGTVNTINKPLGVLLFWRRLKGTSGKPAGGCGSC